MTPEQQQEILKLRALNVTPKQIARKLGLKAVEVTAFIKEQAQEAALAKAQAGELAPIDKCLVDTRCAKRLLFNNSSEKDSSHDGIGGLAKRNRSQLHLLKKHQLESQVDRSSFLKCSVDADGCCKD